MREFLGTWLLPFDNFGGRVGGSKLDKMYLHPPCPHPTCNNIRSGKKTQFIYQTQYVNARYKPYHVIVSHMKLKSYEMCDEMLARQNSLHMTFANINVSES